MHNGAKHPQRCTICGKSFASEEALHSHRTVKHTPQRNNIFNPVQPSTNPVQITPQPEYKCDKCSVTLGSPERLERHTQKVHSKVKCDHCTCLFKNAAADAHEASKHPRYHCNSCDSAFITLEILEKHKSDTHSPNCHYCDDQFPTDTLRYQHELAHHPIYSRFKAYPGTGLLFSKSPVQHGPSGSSSTTCAPMSTSSFEPSHVSSESDLPSGAIEWKVESPADPESSLSEDVLSARRGAPAVPGVAKVTPQVGAVDDRHIEYKCDKCNIALGSQERLDRHQQRVHTEFKCDECNVILRAKKMAQHIRKVHVVMIKCDHCTRTFRSIESLNQHEAAKHSLYLKCDHCEDTFGSFEERIQHQTGHLTHYGDSCDLAFYSLETLQKHSMVRRDLYCRYCSQYFANIDLRDRHENLMHYRNSEAPQRHMNASHSLQEPLVASTSQILIGRSSSSSSGSSVIDGDNDDDSSSSPSTVDQSDLSNDSDTELLESRSASGSQASMDFELSESIQSTATHGTQSFCPHFCVLTFSPAPRIAENRQEHHFVMRDVQSGQNNIGPDEHQAMHTCVSCHRNFQFDEIQIPIHCQFCYKQFEDEESLQQHLTGRISQFCDKCNLQFCYDFLLQEHIETHPTCRKCGQLFAHESELYEVRSSFQLKESAMTLNLCHSIQNISIRLWCAGIVKVR